MHLGALLNLTGFPLRGFGPERLSQLQREIRDALRERVKRIARQHLDGLGTPGAVLECAAIFLNATIVPESNGDPLMKHRRIPLLCTPIKQSFSLTR